jgi:acyl-CoA thioester hydrolase
MAAGPFNRCGNEELPIRFASEDTDVLMQTVQHTFRVMTYDIDFAGVVSNISYIRWLEDLRNLFAEQSLSLGDALQRGIAPTLMHTEIDYLAPVRFPDTVIGRMWLAKHGRSKWELAAKFQSQTTGQLVALAKQIGVFVSLETLRPVRLPKEYQTL